MHCPSCNALNPDDASWCALCLTKFDSSPKQPEVKIDMPAVRQDPVEVQQAWGVVAENMGIDGPELASGPIKTSTAGVTWACPSCGRDNDIKDNRCAVCGTSFFDAFKPPTEASPDVRKDPATAGLMSVLPGLGHLYLSKPAEGITRMLLAAWWWGYAIFVPAPTIALLGVRVLFAMAGLGLVAVSVYDAYRLADNPASPPLFDRRLIAWTTLGLGLMMVIGGVASILPAAR